MRLFSSLTLGALLTLTLTARADTLAGYDQGTDVTNLVTGQAFTISGSGNYTDISFNFFDGDKTTMEAPGTGFLLSQEYLGTPDDLSSSTPGYIASVAGSGGSYNFGSVVLTAGDTYYLYDTQGVAFIGEGSNGQTSFGAAGGSDNFFVVFNTVNLGTDFQVTGTPVEVSAAPTPEPSSFALLLTAAGAGAGLVRRRLRAAR